MIYSLNTQKTALLCENTADKLLGVRNIHSAITGKPHNGIEAVIADKQSILTLATNGIGSFFAESVSRSDRLLA